MIVENVWKSEGHILSDTAIKVQRKVRVRETCLPASSGWAPDVVQTAERITSTHCKISFFSEKKIKEGEKMNREAD